MLVRVIIGLHLSHMHHGPTLRGSFIVIGVIAVCAAIAGIFLFFYLRDNTAVPAPATLSDFPGYKTSLINIDGQAINAAVADTDASRELGLGNRSGLPNGEGMLFIFSSDSKEPFWMKDMYFSIDMIWISVQGSIVYMAQNVSPDTYPENFAPSDPARYVLELPAGYAAAHNFKVGDMVQL
jgi:uncharacterized membrane protein (UPF0127 family)